MSKFSQIEWKRYKETYGKEVIAKFEKLQSEDCPIDYMLEIAKEYDPQMFKNNSQKEMQQWKDVFDFYDRELGDIIANEEIKLETIEDHINFYCLLLHFNTADDPNMEFEKIPQSEFKSILPDNIALTTLLSAYVSQFFIPNFFVTQFILLEKFAEKYEIELPKVPNRADYRERCLYYLDVCIALYKFADENNINSTAELCAFIFDCQFPVIKEEIESEMLKDLPEIPEQAWILCGNFTEGERNMESGLWQANQMTCRGDVMLFYEKSPVKKMNSAWIALEDGRIDPFAYYYSYTYIGKKIGIPDDKAITYNEFKNNEYFKVENRGSKGNYVSKNFQDVSGWQVTFEDYKEIKRMLESKGFDATQLPSLYEPKGFSMEGINNEPDVYAKLVTPLLEEMGWKKDIDFKREVEFAAGHSTTGHAMNKRPDYCLHMHYVGDKVYAKVVIEAKYKIQNNEELKDTYGQCLTYACWGNAKVLVLCDKNTIWVYEQNRNGEFEEDHHKTRYRWAELKNPEKFQELKRKLDI